MMKKQILFISPIITILLLNACSLNRAGESKKKMLNRGSFYTVRYDETSDELAFKKGDKYCFYNRTGYFSYENVEMVNDMIVDNIIFDNNIETDIVNIIRSINMDELNDIVKQIDFSNKSIVILKK